MSVRREEKQGSWDAAHRGRDVGQGRRRQEQRIDASKHNATILPIRYEQEARLEGVIDFFTQPRSARISRKRHRVSWCEVDGPGAQPQQLTIHALATWPIIPCNLRNLN